jgi:CheY-like chemotaxis protein
VPAVDTKASSSPCVLIVEDNDDGRDSLKLLLNLHGCSVETAADGLEGVRKGMQLRPVAAVIDVGLPGMSGYEVAWQLRNLFKNNVFLVAYTAWASPADRERAKQAGFDLLVSKTCQPEELLGILRLGTNLLTKKPALRP